jgi:DNA-binding MarR family transcriptional regulator
MSSQRAASKGASATRGSVEIGNALHRLLAATIRRSPREMGLTALSTLSTLDRSGPRRITDLAAVEGVTQPSMTALVSVLEGSEFVVRLTDPTDKRVVLVAITDSGFQYLRARRQAGAEAFALLIDKLPSEEVKALAAASGALKHLLELDEEQRDSVARPVDERSSGGAS